MAVPVQTPAKASVANGLTTVFPYDFLILDEADLLVTGTLAGVTTTYTLNVHYTVDGVGNDGGGNVTFLAAPANGTTVLRKRNMAYRRDTDYQVNGDLLAGEMNADQDAPVMMIQQLAEAIARALVVPGYLSGTFNATLPAPIPGGYLMIGSDGLSFAIGSTVGSGDLLLRADLASAAAGKGVSLVTYKATGAGAATRTQQAKNDDNRTVEDFGAVGDGVTNDAAAFTAMLVATGGTCRTLDKEYNVGTLLVSGYTRVVFEGARMPASDSTQTKLQGGTVLVGRLNIVSNNITVRNLGVDCGTGRAAVTGGAITEGLVMDAVAAQTGVRIIAQNIASMGNSNASGHAVLIEGFDRGEVNNVYVAKHQYGVVCKSRNVLIANVDADDIGDAACYVKSDLPAFAGSVANASVQNVQVNNVRHRAAASNTTAAAVYVHASTTALAGCQVSNAYQTFGGMALRIQGPGANVDVISGIVANNIVSDNAQKSVSVAGYCYDVMLTDIKATNPATGSAIDVVAQATNWKADGIQVLISDAAITSAICANFAGTGMWDNFTVRNPYRTMVITCAASGHNNIITGKRYGPITITGEGNLTFGSSAVAGPVVPKVKIMPGSIVQLYGQINVQASAGAVGANIGVMTTTAPNTGARFFSCPALNDDGTYSHAIIKVDTFAIYIMTSHAAMTWVDLSGISFEFA